MIRFRFNSIKTTQAAAYLLRRHKGRMSKGILIKLLYLADRELLAKRGQPLTGDQPVSMENGPVLSKTYDLMKGAALEDRAYWEQYVSDARKGESEIMLKQQAGTDQLSKSELDTLEAIDHRFGKFSWKELVAFCHTLPEWKDPGKSSNLIFIEKVLEAIGKSKEEISEIENQATESAFLDLVISSKSAC